MKKRLIKISIAVVFVLLVVIYYYPRQLNKIVIPNVSITISKLSVDKNCNTELSTYEFLPGTDSYNRAISVFNKYSYHRNLHSLFKTNGLDVTKDNSYYFYFDKDYFNNTAEFGGSGELIIDDHSYNMGLWGKSAQLSFMDEIESLLATETPIPQSNSVQP